MRVLIYLLLLAALTACKAQSIIKNKTNISGGGVYVQPIDSSIKKNIFLVHLGNTLGVIFPGAYGYQRFGKNGWGEDKTFFTPDTDMIKRIDKEIINQYCSANRKYNVDSWTRDIAKKDSNNTEAKLKISGIAERLSKYYCDNWQKMVPYYDKQYIGYATKDGEKIIYIKLLDFRQDPHELKPSFTTSWIDGWHGWFNSNTLELHFHIDKNLLTINENL